MITKIVFWVVYPFINLYLPFSMGSFNRMLRNIQIGAQRTNDMMATKHRPSACLLLIATLSINDNMPEFT